MSTAVNDAPKEALDAHGITKAHLGLTGLETGLSEEELAVQETVHRFAEEVMRPIGTELDRMDPEAVIAEDSPLWAFFGQFQELGITASALAELPPTQQGRMLALIYEELGWGDAGLAISLAAGSLPAFVAHHTGDPFLIEQVPDTMIGCWAITEPDHGSDILDGQRVNFAPNGSYGRPNCIVTITDDEVIVNGQKAAWVSNGTIAQVAVLYAMADSGNGPQADGCVLIVPLDRPGISRGKALDKVGQRALNQGEIFFDDVRLPKDYIAVPPEGYQQALYHKLATANALMGSVFTGVARAAYEHALDYAQERKQGGVPIFQHQTIKHKLFEMFRKIEAARALNRAAINFNYSQPVPALQGSIASKITSTQASFEIASEALQVFGGNGLTTEYPVEKLLRDARASLIEDGCNEILALKGASLLVDDSGS